MLTHPPKDESLGTSVVLWQIVLCGAFTLLPGECGTSRAEARAAWRGTASEGSSKYPLVVAGRSLLWPTLAPSQTAAEALPGDDADRWRRVSRVCPLSCVGRNLRRARRRCQADPNKIFDGKFSQSPPCVIYRTLRSAAAAAGPAPDATPRPARPADPCMNLSSTRPLKHRFFIPHRHRAPFYLRALRPTSPVTPHQTPPRRAPPRLLHPAPTSTPCPPLTQARPFRVGFFGLLHPAPIHRCKAHALRGVGRENGVPHNSGGVDPIEQGVLFRTQQAGWR